MTAQTEALKLALEALENSIDAVRQEYETDWRHGYPTREAQLASMKAGVEAHQKAITEIKEALALLQFCRTQSSTPPPKRPWVGLTPDERKKIRFNFDGVENIQLKTEHELKEKNT